MTKLEMAGIVAMINQQYAAETTPALVALWFAALGHYEHEEVKRAAVEVILTYTGTFAPTIGMVATVLRRHAEGSEGTLSEGEAYKLLIDSIKRFGRYNQAGAMFEIRRKSRLVEHAVAILGWAEICGWKTEDEPANRAHFWRVLAGLRQGRERRYFSTPIGSHQLVGDVVKSIGNGSQ